MIECCQLEALESGFIKRDFGNHTCLCRQAGSTSMKIGTGPDNVSQWATTHPCIRNCIRKRLYL